jgi:hypothetical protein
MDLNDNDSDEEQAFKRIMGRVAEGLDMAACVAVLLDLDKEFFLFAASRAFDFVKRQHDFNHKGAE